MKLRSTWIVCVLFLLSVAVHAQSSASPDPISGTWKGEMGPHGQNRTLSLIMELKFDGKNITGTVTGPPSPGEIKTGSFDSNTGSLKFGVEVKDGGTSRFDFDGTVVTDTAIGHVSGNNQTGNFKISKVSGQSTVVQQSGGEAALRGGFAEVSGWVTKAADLVPADKYSYRPTQTVRTFGQLVAHVADSYTFFCARAAGRKVEWSDAIEKGTTDKAALVQKLKQTTDACNAVYGASGDAGQLLGNVGHTSLHYGNMITYIRMLGLVPPSN
jgi:DinB superfamily